MEQQSAELCSLVFEKVGDPNSSTPQGRDREVVFSERLIGSLFVQNYHLFRKDCDNATLVFLKKHQMQTHYLLLKFLTAASPLPAALLSLRQTLQNLSAFRPKKSPLHFKVVVAWLDTQQQQEIPQETFEKEEQPLNRPPPSAVGRVVEREEALGVVGGQELQAIKAIVWSYLDTFGARHRDNLFLDWQRQGNRFLDIERILYTLDWILYRETAGEPYTQLESSNWTCFQAQAKQKCKSDRKEIVLTGSGCILFIPLLFICQKLEAYKKDNERELREVMEESRKYYVRGEIKAYLITDRIDPHSQLYLTESLSLHRFGC